MAQLKMYWFPDQPIHEEPLPEGYSISRYKTEADKLAWVECCKNGLVGDDATAEAFDNSITSNRHINLFEDVFFLDYGGEHIGTVTAFVNSEHNFGDMHMVGIRTDFRGRGLAKYLNFITQKHLKDRGLRFVLLTTDEWRKGAVKSYLNGGFLPVEYALGMEDRWQAVLEEYGIDSVQMVYEDGSPYKTVFRKGLSKKVRFGVFGAGRGQSMMDFCVQSGGAELVAICDRNEERLAHARETYGGASLACYTDFEDFIQHDMDCVVLANCANEHAPFAVKALNAGKNVFSELLPVQTMKEAVELAEAVEKSGKRYFYGENCCYMPAPKKMKELYKKGALGAFEYGEGEYMHNCESIWAPCTFCEPDHWRNTMSAFYYCTHSLGPIVHITGLRPAKVTGFEAPFNHRMYRMGAKAGAYGIELVTMENGALVKSTHGVGVSNHSLWYMVNGSKGVLESAREPANAGEVNTLYGELDENEGDNNRVISEIDTKDALTETAKNGDHGGADYYTLYHVVEALRGNRNADVIDVYEALDMFLPGMFAYFSVLAGGVPMEIPDLRQPEAREKWRNDTRCTDPKAKGNEILPSYSKGNPVIPADVYEKLKEKQR